MTPLAKKLMMQMEGYSLSRQARGRARIFLFDPKTGVIHKIVENHNDIVYSGADVMAKLLSGASGYAVNTMYMEFKNLPSPLDPIVPPSFDRTGGIAYYNGLSSSPDTDFLRVPIQITPTISAGDSNYLGNIVTFFAISEGSTGFWSKIFSHTVNSAVFGGALVASPDPTDQTQDVVFSRIYSGIDKVLKTSGMEIGITWPIEFK